MNALKGCWVVQSQQRKARFQMALPSLASEQPSGSSLFLNPFFAFSLKNITILDGGRRIETRTRLVRIEFTVAYDTSLGIRLMQHSKHLVQDDHLLGGAVVLVLVLGTARMATFVADANTLSVEAPDVATSL